MYMHCKCTSTSSFLTCPVQRAGKETSLWDTVVLSLYSRIVLSIECPVWCIVGVAPTPRSLQQNELMTMSLRYSAINRTEDEDQDRLNHPRSSHMDNPNSCSCRSRRSLGSSITVEGDSCFFACSTWLRRSFRNASILRSIPAVSP